MTEPVHDPIPMTHAQFRLAGMGSIPLFTRNGETIVACRDDLFVAHVACECVLFPDSPVVVQWQIDTPNDVDTTYIVWAGSHRIRLGLGQKTRPELRKLLRWLKETCIRMGLVLMVEEDPAPVIPF